MDEGAWRLDARCRGVNPDLFFPERGAHEDVASALEVCNACPVWLPCLEDAMVTDDDGVWGRTTKRQRRLLRIRARAAGVTWREFVGGV